MTAPENRNPRIKEAMDLLLKIFDEDNLEKVAHAVFRGSGNIPSDKWSFFNRIVMFMHDTEDARGFKQWHEAGRHVMKGSKAFYILGPVFKKIKDEKPTASSETREDRKRNTCRIQGYPCFQERGHRRSAADNRRLTNSIFPVSSTASFRSLILRLCLCGSVGHPMDHTTFLIKISSLPALISRYFSTRSAMQSMTSLTA